VTTDGIFVRVLGDYGPFSTMGKSIGYHVTIGAASFLVDCGAPLFQQIGGHGLKNVRGLIITHCHDDHKRWFSDLALFNRYAPDMGHRVPLFTSEQVDEGLRIASGPAIHTSLDRTAKQVIDLAYDDYVDFHCLGPRPLYRIVRRDAGAGATVLAVVDCEGAELPPERAKIVISSRNGEPRLLFKDPDYGEWVEPENFYPFSSTTFYEAEQNTHHDPAGFTIEALNAPVWHGLPGIGLRFRTAREALVFSADTAHDTELWHALAEEKCHQRLPGTREEFEAAAVIHGDINDYIERRWSAERLHEALHAFDDAAVIHDIATRMSIVHTDYRRLGYTVLDRERTLLTHSPDKMTSEWALSKADKTFAVRGRRFYEVVGNRLWPMDAAVYHKEEGRYYVGYRSEAGEETVYAKDGLVNLGGPYNWERGTPLYRVDLYEDIGGRYFPKLAADGDRYVERPDGRVEIVTYTPEGSRGTIVSDQRERLSRRV
jgi:hypothetical protein